MRRLILPALLLTLSIPGALTTVRAAQQRPTFVTNQQVTLLMKNGERRSGTLVYHNDSNFNLIANGEEKAYPVNDIALVDLSGGADPSTQELNQLPTSNDPPELQRHMVVLKDGTTVRGKLYTIKETSISFDNEQGQRRDFDLSNISRLYVSAPGARQLYASRLNQAQNPVSGTTGANGEYILNANQSWLDTGRTVRRGQQLTIQATGEIHFGSGGDQTATPNGKGGDPSQPTLPVPQAPVGALIGRIGNGTPFSIGAVPATFAAPGSGRLFIGVNDRELSDNSGTFAVTIR